MKPLALFLLSLGAALTLSVSVRSQSPAPLNPVQQLQLIKAENDKLLEKQAATLLKLDEMILQAQQIKFLGKRS